MRNLQDAPTTFINFSITGYDANKLTFCVHYRDKHDQQYISEIFPVYHHHHHHHLYTSCTIWVTLVTWFHSGFSLDSFFDSEDGGYMLLRNVQWLVTDYTALYPRRQNCLSTLQIEQICWSGNFSWRCQFRILPKISVILTEVFRCFLQ
jgi:hypothetical protein